MAEAKTGAGWAMAVATIAALAGCSPAASDGSLSDFDATTFCAAALHRAQALAPEIADADMVPGAAPVKLSPTRYQCGISDGDKVGVFTIDVNCSQALDAGCATVSAVNMNGEVLYPAPAAHRRRKRR